MTSTFKVLIKKSIILLMLFNFTIVLTKSSFQLTTSLSKMLPITVLGVSSKTYIKFSDFQPISELLMTEKVLPFTDEVNVVLVHGARTFRPRTFRPRTFRPGHFGHGHFGRGHFGHWTFRPQKIKLHTLCFCRLNSTFHYPSILVCSFQANTIGNI